MVCGQEGPQPGRHGTNAPACWGKPQPLAGAYLVGMPLYPPLEPADWLCSVDIFRDWPPPKKKKKEKRKKIQKVYGGSASERYGGGENKNGHRIPPPSTRPDSIRRASSSCHTPLHSSGCAPDATECQEWGRTGCGQPSTQLSNCHTVSFTPFNEARYRAIASNTVRRPSSSCTLLLAFKLWQNVNRDVDRTDRVRTIFNPNLESCNTIPRPSMRPKTVQRAFQAATCLSYPSRRHRTAQNTSRKRTDWMRTAFSPQHSTHIKKAQQVTTSFLSYCSTLLLAFRMAQDGTGGRTESERPWTHLPWYARPLSRLVPLKWRQPNLQRRLLWYLPPSYLAGLSKFNLMWFPTL